MANTTIKIKRSFANNVPSILREGELAYSYLSNTLFIGSSANTPITIASANVIGRVAGLEANSYIAPAAYTRANQAYALADSARIDAFYANALAVAVSSQVQSAANTVRVSKNGTGSLSGKQLNFVDGASVSFSVTDAFNGNANISAAVAANLNIDALSTAFIDFDKLPYFQYPGYVEGRMWYNQNAHSIQFQTDFDSFDAVPGQIEYVRVYNNTGVQIDKGKAVYVTGVKGSSDPVDSRILSIALADATDGNKKDVLGLVGHNIPNGSEGFVITRGPLYGINTSNLVPNDRFHLAPSPGALAGYAPEYPNWPMDLGQCLTQDAVYGSVYVDIVDHSFERMRVLYDGYIGGNFVVEGDLTVFGTQNFVSASDFYVGGQFLYLDGADAINVDSTIFTGSGLNDMTFKGIYEGDAASTSFYVRIASAGVQGLSVDKFDWSYNSSFSPLQGSNISITGTNQSLANGISVKFVSLLGHTVGDQWSGTAYATNRDFGIIGHYNDGTYKHAGLFRDSVDGDFKFFTRYVPEPAGDINASGATFQLGNVRVDKITANSFYKGGIDLYSAINSAANTTAIYANNTLRLANAGINFVNTSTIRATVSTGSGIANISFDLIGSTGGIASFPVASGSSIVSANGLNFVNSATVGVTVSAGVSGNADISFTTLAGGGSVTSVDTGLGLIGGPITTAGTISANIASTTKQGVTKLVDAVNSNDSANAATAASVKTAYDQATTAYGQANVATSTAISAYGQANLAYSQANSAYAAANSANSVATSAYNQANIATSTAISAYGQANTATTIGGNAYGQANLAYAQANTANSIAISAYDQANIALTVAYASANGARVTANSGPAFSNVSLNFVNTSTVQVSVSSVVAGVANIGFTSTATGGGTGTLNNFPVSVNTGSTVVANGINFINSATVTVSITPGTSGNANVSFTAVTGGTGTVTQVNTGTGLNGGGFTTSGTISANIANTTEVGVTKLIDVVTSNDSGNAATAASVKTAFDQATLAYGQANTATSQAASANNNANNRVLKSGDVMTGQLNISSGGLLVTGIANVSGDIVSNSTFRSLNRIGSEGGEIFLSNAVTSTIQNGVTIDVYDNKLRFFETGGTNRGAFIEIPSAGAGVSSNLLAGVATGVTSISVGLGLTGSPNPITATGTISANIASTTSQGVTKLIDSVTSTDAANAATAASVKTAFEQGNSAYTQANTANSIAISAYGQANAAFTAANNAANTVRVTANSGAAQSAVSLNFINTSSVIVSVGSGSTGNANVSFSVVAGSTTVPGILQLNDTVINPSTTLAATANAVKAAYEFAGTKYSSSGGTISGDVTITGNLILTGGTSQLNVTNLSVNDSIILLGTNNISDVLDIGFVGHYRTGGGVNSHAGFVRKATDKTFYLFDNYEVEPTNNVIDISGNNFRLGNVRLGVMNANSILVLGTSVATVTDVAAAYGQANIANTTAVSAYGQANAAYSTANSAANTVRVTANSLFAQSAVSLNFINTASIQVSVGAGTTGNANVGFTAISGSTTTAGILQLTDSVTSTSTTTAATPNSVKSAFDQGNNAYTQANTANSIAISAYGQANSALNFANNAANTVRVTANSGSAQSAVSLNFINTASIQVSVGGGATGNANVGFTAVAGTTSIAGIVQLTDSTTSTSTTTAATPNSVKSAFDQATLAYGQANTANTTSVSAYGQANAATAAAASAANATRVSANSGGTLSNVSLNFVNTSTVLVSVSPHAGATGIANIAFTSTVAPGSGTGTLNNFPVSVNTVSTVTANGLNFINSATVTVTVTPGVNGNANVSFTSTGGTGTPGGSNTQIQYNNNGSFGGSNKFTYNTAPNLVSVDADLKLANTNKLYFGGEQANNSVANSKFSISFNVSATSLDFTFLG